MDIIGIITACILVGVVGLLIGILLGVADKFLAVKEDERVIKSEKHYQVITVVAVAFLAVTDLQVPLLRERPVWRAVLLVAQKLQKKSAK